MIKMMVSFSVIVSALHLTEALGSLLNMDANFDLGGQDIQKEAKCLAQLQCTKKRARTVPVEMKKISVAFSVIVCALHLTLTLGSPIDTDANSDLTGQDIDQESKLLAQLQDAIKRAKAVNVEGQHPYSALGEIVQKDSLSEDDPLNKDLQLSKPNKRRTCWAFCWG